MLNFILNAIADFCEPLCTRLHIRFIIYLCSMYVDICFWYLFFTVVVLVFGFFVVYAFVALTSFVINQLIITELFSISCFSRSLG